MFKEGLKEVTKERFLPRGTIFLLAFLFSINFVSSISVNIPQPPIISGANYSINTNYSNDAGHLEGRDTSQLYDYFKSLFNSVYMYINGTNSNIQFLQFNLTNTQTPAEGKLYWNDNDGTLNIGMKGGNVNLQVGQEMLLRVKNDQGSQINNGEVVYVSNATGNNILVKLADADLITAHQTIGIATENIVAGQHGYITLVGMVRDINTTGFTEGSPIYLSQTAGKYTHTIPTAPAHTVKLGYITRTSSTVGELYASIQIGQDLSNLDDVLIVNPSNGQVLVYNSTSGLWANKNVSSIVNLSDRLFTNGTNALPLVNMSNSTVVMRNIEIDSKDYPGAVLNAPLMTERTAWNFETTYSELYGRFKDAYGEGYFGIRSGQFFLQSDNSIGNVRIENYGGGLGGLDASVIHIGENYPYDGYSLLQVDGSGSFRGSLVLRADTYYGGYGPSFDFDARESGGGDWRMVSTGNDDATGAGWFDFYLDPYYGNSPFALSPNQNAIFGGFAGVDNGYQAQFVSDDALVASFENYNGGGTLVAFKPIGYPDYIWYATDDGNSEGAGKMCENRGNNGAIAFNNGGLGWTRCTLENGAQAIGSYSDDGTNSIFQVNNQSSMQRIIPQITNTYDLGSSSYFWNKLWVKDINSTGTATFTNLNVTGLIYGNGSQFTGIVNKSYVDSGDLWQSDGSNVSLKTAQDVRLGAKLLQTQNVKLGRRAVPSVPGSWQYGKAIFNDAETNYIQGASGSYSFYIAGQSSLTVSANEFFVGYGSGILDLNSYVTDDAVNFYSTISTNTNTNRISFKNSNLRTTGNFELMKDNSKLTFGDALDASFYYDGTNMIINPKEIGSGILNVLGQVNSTALATGEVNATNTKIVGNLNQTSGNATINLIYGEIYNKSDTGFYTVDLVTVDTYVAVDNLTAGNINGFNRTAFNLTAQYAGLYKVGAKFGMLASGGAGGDNGMKVFVNSVGQDNCYDHEHTSTTAPIGFIIDCLVRLNVGDNVSVRFDDHQAPVTDLIALNGNLNLVRMAN